MSRDFQNDSVNLADSPAARPQAREAAASLSAQGPFGPAAWVARLMRAPGCIGDARGREGVAQDSRICRAGYGDGFEGERVAKDLKAGLGEGVVVDAAGIAQQGAVDIEEVGVILIPVQAGTAGDAALSGAISAIARRGGRLDDRIRQSGRRLLTK